MDLKKLTQRAKKVVEDRGGADTLKQDLNEIKDIAKGKGSISEKAKEAAAALKHPGAAAEAGEHRADPDVGAPPAPAEPDVHPMGPDEPSAPDAGLQPDPEAPKAPEPEKQP